MRLYDILLCCSSASIAIAGIYGTVQGELLPLTCALAVSLFLIFAGRYRLMLHDQKHQEELDTLQTAFDTHRKTAEAERLATIQSCEERKQNEILQFQRDLSHSVRVPLSIVQGYAELLSGNITLDEASKREYLAKIIQRSKFIGTTLEQQMSAARSEESLFLSKGEVDLLQLIHQSVHDFQASATFHGIGLQVVDQGEPIVVLGDSFQLTRAFYNIVENSTKYMGREGMVTIRLYSTQSTAHLIIKDDGMGLSPDETTRIFEPHFQGSNRQGGHGYGLTLTKKIVEAHDGSITAQSNLGAGMELSMTFPLLLPEGQVVDL